MAKLLGLKGVTVGREYPIGELCIIGRSPNAHVRLPDRAVSRLHAKITRSVNGFIIEDQGSSLGTLVNRVSVTVSHLRHNDELAVGGATFRFLDGPVDKVATADFSLTYDEGEAQVVSVDASEFARLPPVAEGIDAGGIARLTRRLNAMLAVARVASSTLEPAQLQSEVLRYCLEVFPAAQRALVATPNRESQTMAVRSLVQREGVAGGQFYLSRSITSEVLYKGRAVISNGGVAEGAAKHASGVWPGVSLMVAPLICHGQMLGLIYVDNLQSGSAFNEEDIEVLTGMTAQVALALYTAQMHDSLMHKSQVDQELLAAHEVQKRFMPRGVPRLPGFTFVAHYDPSREVGGDLYDFITLDANHVGIVIGDVSGKGFGAALVMAWVASQLRVAAHQERRPTDVLRRVNESLLEARQDDLFVTLFYGVLDRLTMSIDFCNAGHVPPLVRRTRGRVEIVEDGAGMPVGVVAGTTFDEGRILLDRGDIIVLVSDGVTEAMDPQKRMFGIDGLRTALAQGPGSPTDLVCSVLAELRAFVREEPQYDDITLVAVGASGGGTGAEDIRATLLPGAFPTED